jgi:prevent-host-death family protein
LLDRRGEIRLEFRDARDHPGRRLKFTGRQRGSEAGVVRARAPGDRAAVPDRLLTIILTMGIIVVTVVRGEVFVETIQASEFKAKCLALMDEVARTGRTIVVTKNGKPVAELRPHRPPRASSLIGLHKGQTKILGDIVSPIGTRLWKALK